MIYSYDSLGAKEEVLSEGEVMAYDFNGHALYDADWENVYSIDEKLFKSEDLLEVLATLDKEDLLNVFETVKENEILRSHMIDKYK